MNQELLTFRASVNRICHSFVIDRSSGRRRKIHNRFQVARAAPAAAATATADDVAAADAATTAEQFACFEAGAPCDDDPYCIASLSLLSAKVA